MHLPVDDVLDEVRAALETAGRFVLQAPPGAGKTTRVPPALLSAPWRAGGRILVLEPRRLAARAAAQHMARERGEQVGQTVGYSTRDERRVSAATAIEVITEGILVRRLQRDPSLQGTAVVLFDEFHERNLAADLGLALTLDARAALRPDLRIGVMSATLAATRVADLLDDAPVITSEGRRYPVETHYRPRVVSRRVEAATVEAIRVALDETEGDVLVFLPGAGEIRRVERALGTGPGILVAPLFGALPPSEQDRALAPSPSRKVVLATDIAETSLTIEGVRVVIDSGLTREPRFDPGTAMTRLETVRISQASAEQRRGRAGRTAPGVCYRLWAERENAGLEPHRVPELAQVDLAGFALELAGWGADGPSELRFLDAPPRRAYQQAVALLRDLEAIDDERRITDHGRELLALPVHPRLAHAAVGARDRGLDQLGCEVAALLADRDVLSSPRDVSHADLTTRVRVLRGERPPRRVPLRRGALQRARRERDRLASVVGDGPRPVTEPPDVERTGEVVALAYPDRVAQQRGRRGSFLLANGRGASLPEHDVLAGEEWLVIAAAGGIGGAGEDRIHLAAPITASRLREVLAHAIETETVVAWDDDSGDVVAEERTVLGALTLERAPLADPSAREVSGAILDGIRARGLDLLPWTRDTRDLRARLDFLHRTLGDPWPDMSEEALLADLEDWLAPYLTNVRRRSDLEAVPLRDALLGLVGWERARRVDELAPTHLQVPSGARVRLDYHQGEIPVLPVRVQQAFGWTETPRVAGGRVPVMVHLLSPAQRPVQVTQDLAGFWERGYPEVRKDLRGRYPKHPWPEDPLEATPTDRAKRR
ncbi:MAG: ATP-dependent helicase HrpB [Nitriliruptorales bacterium]|nr:ATP-dependent helicase HrpB [Nitriliruptorales bacterium]